MQVLEAGATRLTAMLVVPEAALPELWSRLDMEAPDDLAHAWFDPAISGAAPGGASGCDLIDLPSSGALKTTFGEGGFRADLA